MSSKTISLIQEALRLSAETKLKMAQDLCLTGLIEQAAARMIRTVQNGGTIYTCGNGGSACDAMHFAEELIARYKLERPGIRAMHMMDPGTLTCWSNDYDFDGVFERYVQTFCTKKDLLVAISTSGNSQNIINALQAAKKAETFTIGLTGRGGGCMKELCDICLIVPSDATERIQEMHITLIHIFCQVIEAAVTQP